MVLPRPSVLRTILVYWGWFGWGWKPQQDVLVPKNVQNDKNFALVQTGTSHEVLSFDQENSARLQYELGHQTYDYGHDHHVVRCASNGMSVLSRCQIRGLPLRHLGSPHRPDVWGSKPLISLRSQLGSTDSNYSRLWRDRCPHDRRAIDGAELDGYWSRLLLVHNRQLVFNYCRYRYKSSNSTREAIFNASLRQAQS